MSYLYFISDDDGAIQGSEGALFLRRSGLGNEQLREIWRLASGGTSKQSLDHNDWLVACKLVAAVQQKAREPNMQLIVTSEPIGFADFHYGMNPDVDAIISNASNDISASSIRVTCTNPTTYGSGISKHTKYNVQTSTSLQHFPRKEISVWRRYSDFEWLHERLSLVYPSAIIPIFPAKRILNSDDDFVKETLFLHKQDKFEFDFHEHVMPIQGMCKEDYGNYLTYKRCDLGSS
jgi:hypothetical protein